MSEPMKSDWRIPVAGAALLLSCFFALCWLAQEHNSVTVDEFAHLPAGYYYWRTGDFSLYPKNPPLVKLIVSLPLAALRPSLQRDLGAFPRGGWIPWYFGTDFMYRNQASYLRLFRAGRALAVLLGCGLGLLLFLLSRKLYGDRGGLLSLAVFAFCPNFLAHAGLATTDVGASLFLLAAVATLMAYLRRPTWGRTALAGLALGCAQASKFSALPLLALYAAAPLLLVRSFSRERPGFRALRVRFLQVGAMLALGLAVIAACYGGKYLFRPLGEFDYQSRALKWAKTEFPRLRAPLPLGYLAGLDNQLVDATQGEFPNYLRGHWYRGTNWAYYPVVVYAKLPIPLMLLTLLAVLSALGAFGKRAAPGPEEKVLFGTAVLLLLGLVLANRLQIGIRYLLPVFPLLFVLLGRLAPAAGGGTGAKKVVLTGLLAWSAAGALAAYPHYLSYFNEFAGGSRGGHRLLLDSNLDWGQDLPALATWMRGQGVDRLELAYFGHVSPRIYGIDYQIPGTGPRLPYTAVSAQLLFGAGNFSYPMFFHLGAQNLPAEQILPYQDRPPVTIAGGSIWIFAN